MPVWFRDCSCSACQGSARSAWAQSLALGSAPAMRFTSALRVQLRHAPVARARSSGGEESVAVRLPNVETADAWLITCPAIACQQFNSSKTAKGGTDDGWKDRNCEFLVCSMLVFWPVPLEVAPIPFSRKPYIFASDSLNPDFKVNRRGRSRWAWKLSLVAGKWGNGL